MECESESELEGPSEADLPKEASAACPVQIPDALKESSNKVGQLAEEPATHDRQLMYGEETGQDSFQSTWVYDQDGTTNDKEPPAEPPADAAGTEEEAN